VSELLTYDPEKHITFFPLKSFFSKTRNSAVAATDIKTRKKMKDQTTQAHKLSLDSRKKETIRLVF